jgi:hypothetical protein
VIAPSAALASFPYLPAEAMGALKFFLQKLGRRIGDGSAFVDAFSEHLKWYSRTYLAVDQGPIVIMIESFRTGLLWNLFMGAPEIRKGLSRLGFASPHLRLRRQSDVATNTEIQHASPD